MVGSSNDDPPIIQYVEDGMLKEVKVIPVYPEHMAKPFFFFFFDSVPPRLIIGALSFLLL